MKKFLSFCLIALSLITPSFADNEADKKVVTSLQYVKDELNKKQDNIPAQTSGTYAVTYGTSTTHNAGEISPRQIKTSLGTNISDTSLPTVGAVNTEINKKQDKIPAKDTNTVVTYTGTVGVVGEKGIYQDEGAYSAQVDNLVEAGAFNTAVKTGLDSEFLCAGNASGGDCWLWSIHNETDPELPPEYTRLEYLIFDGASYINTGVVLTDPKNIENVIEMKASGTSSFQTWTGFMPSSTTPRYGVHFYSGKWMIGINTTVNSTASADTAKHTVKFVTTNNAQTLYDTNGTTLATTGLSADFSSNTLALYVGARNQGASAGNYVTGNIGPTYLKQNGTVLYNYIPARRNSDGVVGMYDTVSGTLKTKSGSGTITAGPVVTDNVPFTTLVPDGYTPIEYIETTGTQWIDTGIRGHMGYTYDLDFQQTTTGNFRTWGVFNQSSYVGPNMSFTYCSGWCSRWESVAGQQRSVTLPSINTNRHNLHIADGKIYFDDVYKGISEGHDSSFVFNYNLFLGTINPGGSTPTTSTKAKIYSYRVWDTNGTLIQNLVPAKQGSVVGMYDTVSGTFKTNAGSGTFTAGPDISNVVYMPQEQ